MATYLLDDIGQTSVSAKKQWIDEFEPMGHEGMYVAIFPYINQYFGDFDEKEFVIETVYLTKEELNWAPGFIHDRICAILRNKGHKLVFN